MHQNKYKEIATKYSVQDYLKQQVLLALLQYAQNEITFTAFQALAKLEQPDRRLANEEKQSPLTNLS
jgi:hypothetical protein